MGRMYSASFEDVAVTAVQDLFELTAASNVAVVIHEIELSQITQAASELLQIKLHRGTSSGSGGTAASEIALDPGMPTADSAVEINNTTQSVETNLLRVDHWNVVNPYLYVPTPETRILVPGAGLFIVELETAPGASMTMSGTLIWEELG